MDGSWQMMRSAETVAAYDESERAASRLCARLEVGSSSGAA
jgi:hypothetical protein